MTKALFITLDDTLIFTRSGRKYPIHSRDWMVNIDLAPTIKKYYKEGYIIILVDNQDSVAHGSVHSTVFDIKIEEVLQVSEALCDLPTNHISFMFWTGDTDEYSRLPNPGMIYELASEYELYLGDSILIGSSDDDYKLVKCSGIGKYIDIDTIK